MGPEAAAALLDGYARLTGDRGVARRLPFYRAAYLAFRAAYAMFSCEQLVETDDGLRFRRAAAWYRARLQQVLNG